MIDRLQELLEAFEEAGISRLVPGFYNDLTFIQLERQYPDLLDLYAEYSLLAAGEQHITTIWERTERVADALGVSLSSLFRDLESKAQLSAVRAQQSAAQSRSAQDPAARDLRQGPAGVGNRALLGKD
jgi:hypothetical protein